MEYVVVNIFGAIIEYFALFTFLWIYFDVDPSRKKWILFWHIVMPICFFLFSTYIENIYLRPTLFVLCSWLVALNFRGDFWARIFSISVFQIILILLEIGVSFLLHPIDGLSTKNFYLAINIFIKLATVGILIVLFFISKKRQVIFAQLKFEYVLMLLMFSAVSLFLVSFTEYLLMMLDQVVFFIVGCIAILLCVCVNVALYYLFYQLAVGEEAKARIQFIDFYLNRQREQQNYMEHNYHEIRKLSHDMDHYLSVVYHLLQQGKITEAMEELKKRQIEITQKQLFDTGYSLLNSILTFKFLVAQEQHIQTQLFWNVSEKLYLNLTDLSVILSNGLDNAIEAARQVRHARPFVSVRAELKGDFLKLVISNNAAVAPLIVNGKIATTKENKHLHGLGLESIQTLARRYHGESFVNYSQNIFTLTVILKNTASV